MKERERPAYPQEGVATTCRSYAEYVAMFALTESDVAGKNVLDVAGGASSFAAELRARGIAAVAADPFYAKSPEDAVAYAAAEIETSSAKLKAISEKAGYDWSYYGTPERHRRTRERSLELFAEDFRSPGAETRYVPAGLPTLPFEEGSFDLAVCSHFLFLYAESFGEPFHRAALRELLRVLKPGGEARIYPLVSLKWESVPYVKALAEELGDVAKASFVDTGLPFVPVRSSVLRLVKLG